MATQKLEIQKNLENVSYKGDNMKKLLFLIALFATVLSFNMVAQGAVIEKTVEVAFDETLSSGLTYSMGSFEINIEGVLKQFVVDSHDLSVSSEVSLSVSNRAGQIIYTSGNYAENAVTAVRISEDTAPLLTRNCKINIFTTASQDLAVDDTIKFIMYIHKED